MVGLGVYELDGFVMSHSGRPVPGESDLVKELESL